MRAHIRGVFTGEERGRAKGVYDRRDSLPSREKKNKNNKTTETNQIHVFRHPHTFATLRTHLFSDKLALNPGPYNS